MSVKKGAFILVNYVAKIKETDEIFDTTIAEEAKTGGIFKDNTIYEPMFVVIGENWVLQKLDNSLIGIKVDDKTTIEIPPEDGFGLRDPTKIKIIPISRFRKQDITPYPGAQIELEGRSAVVRSVGAGRVQVDFNPPLAGKTLLYELVVLKIIEKDEEQINALIHRRVPTINIETFNFNISEKEITIVLPEAAIYLQGIQFAKRGIASDLQKFFSYEKVTFSEVFTKPPQPLSEEPLKQEENSSDIGPDP